MFVRVLAVSAFGHDAHDDVLGGCGDVKLAEFDLGLKRTWTCAKLTHEGEFVRYAFRNDSRIDYEAGGYVVEEDAEGIGAEEHFGNVDAADRAVVERSFEPLRGVRVGGGFVEGGQFATETADSFGAHRVSFIGHGGGAYLVFFERLFEFFEHS